MQNRERTMKHESVLQQVANDAKADPNTLGILLFGSVASGTHNEGSDIDLILVYKSCEPASGLVDAEVDGVKVGTIFFTYETLARAAETVPYLLHIVGSATLLFDRNETTKPLIDRIEEYFNSHPDVEEEWNRIYDRFREEKSQYGCEQTSIIQVWDELEGRHSGGELKRTFFRYLG
jgi:predicted nucleotidyltransferase